MTRPSVMWQGGLLGAEEPVIDRSFRALVRHRLDASAWVDHAPLWLSGADELFARLLDDAPWQQRHRHMYDRTVAEPRLTAGWSPGADAPFLPAPIEDMRAALSGRYGVTFDSVWLNLYRDGRDSVAWHGDRIARTVEDPIVAIVSLGHRRTFALRPKGRSTGGGTPRRFALGDGDLLVMGGSSQRTWEHAVPKIAGAGARLSVTFRHSE